MLDGARSIVPCGSRNGYYRVSGNKSHRISSKLSLYKLDIDGKEEKSARQLFQLCFLCCCSTHCVLIVNTHCSVFFCFLFFNFDTVLILDKLIEMVAFISVALVFALIYWKSLPNHWVNQIYLL